MPQALSYLVDDVSRRFGTIRVGAAESFLRSDDEAALTELVHHPRAGVAAAAPDRATVVVSDVPVDVLLPRLRELGQRARRRGTRRDGPAGPPRGAARPHARASSRRPAPDAVRCQAARVAATVTAVRAGDRAAAAPTRSRPCAPPSRPPRPRRWRCCTRRSSPGGSVWIGVRRQPRLDGRAGRRPGQRRGRLAVGLRPPHRGRPLLRGAPR